MIITSLTILAILIAGLFVYLVWFPEDVAGPGPVGKVVSLVAFPCILICSIGILVTMRHWLAPWPIRVWIVLLLLPPLFITGFIWWVIICFPAI